MVASSLLVLTVGCRDRNATPAAAPSDRPIRRIIALAPNAAEIICDLGARDWLVGVSRFCTYPPELETVQKIGGLRDPDLETIIGLRPDMMILRGQGAAVRELCHQRGIKVYDDAVETLDDLYKTITDLGGMLDRQNAADQLIHEIRSKLAAIAHRAAGLDRPTLFFVVMRSRGKIGDLMTAGRDTFLNELMTIAGGINVFGDLDVRYPRISQEDVIVRGPEIIIESRPGQDIDDESRKQILAEWDVLGSVPAVQSGRIHLFDEPYITIPSKRVVLTAGLLQSVLHPEIASGG